MQEENQQTVSFLKSQFAVAMFLCVVIVIASIAINPAISVILIPLIVVLQRKIIKCTEPYQRLVDAQVTADSIIEEANKQSNQTIQEANQKSNEIIQERQSRLQDLNNKLSDKEKTYQSIVDEAEKEIKQNNQTLTEENERLFNLKRDLSTAVQSLQGMIVELNDEVLYQEFGLYKPMFNFTSSERYKIELDAIRNQQKQLIKNDTAALAATEWTVNNSKTEGKRMTNNMKKLLLRSFNNECDICVSKVKYNNFDSIKKRITNSYTAISKLGSNMQLSINPLYYEMKIKELHLAFEYEQKKQEEKEHQKEIREQERELAKLRREIEEERKKIKKEKMHYASAIVTAKEQLALSTDPAEREAIQTKIDELEETAKEIDKNLVDIDYREANQRAGYVYIISNIGSFGKDIYKIGMTRRLNPMDRIDELGDASVPFNFDVHALIFSDNAPQLEAALHQAFDAQKLNLVNTRREFFNVSLKDIERVVKENFDGTVEFVEIPEATQYRESKKMKESAQTSEPDDTQVTPV